MNIPFEIFLAHQVLGIWNPCIWNLLQDEKRRRQLQLSYLARGIVLHDRILNREIV